MGKKKNLEYMPFEEARQFMREQCIPSRSKFFQWRKENLTKAIPQSPHRVYKNEWKGWNDFLGNNNKMTNMCKKSHRSLQEAIVWVHKLKIENQKDWFDYCKTNRQTMPEDIPSRPDLVYNDWLSWSHWLGNKPRQKVEAQLSAQSTSIYYIIHEQTYPLNVLSVGVMNGGKSALKDKWEREKFNVIKLFKYRPEMQGAIDSIIEYYSTSWYGDKYIRIVPMINQMIWNLSNIMEIIP